MKLEASDIGDPKPVIVEAVRAVLDEIRAAEETVGLNGRLGFTEIEAAEALGVRPHVPRDVRLRGKISARLVGYVYSRATLVKFLANT